MSFFSNLFGAFKSDSSSSEEVTPVEYKGYLIYFEPRDQNGQFGVGARITLGEGENLREHRFLRADTLPSKEICEEVTLLKAKSTIDQQGERLFS